MGMGTFESKCSVSSLIARCSWGLLLKELQISFISNDSQRVWFYSTVKNLHISIRKELKLLKDLKIFKAAI